MTTAYKYKKNLPNILMYLENFLNMWNTYPKRIKIVKHLIEVPACNVCG